MQKLTHTHSKLIIARSGGPNEPCGFLCQGPPDQSSASLAFECNFALKFKLIGLNYYFVLIYYYGSLQHLI